VFGLPGFRGEQETIVRHVTDGGNSCADATGGGKSLCYQLPSLFREAGGIVVLAADALMATRSPACSSRVKAPC